MSKVHIKKFLPFGNIRSSHTTSKIKSRHRTVSNIMHQDVWSCAICVANNSIQKANIRITNTYIDDPLLHDSASFSCIDVAFGQGWERRYNNIESTLYGHTYIDTYNHSLVSLFEEGNEKLSKKMNPAMMREKSCHRWLYIETSIYL